LVAALAAADSPAGVLVAAGRFCPKKSYFKNL